MTGPATGPDGATPVDRRWFEEALRSQGFVVEPPADDVQADSAPDTDEESLTAEPDVQVATSSVERPPMPSALLARIAARGQPAPVTAPIADPAPIAEPGPLAAPATIAEPEPLAAPATIAEPLAAPATIAEPERITEPEWIAEPDPVPVSLAPPPPEAARPAPWASAVVAPVAPWSSTAEPMVAPEADVREPVEDFQPASEPTVPQVPQPAAPEPPAPVAPATPSAAVSAALDSPYTPLAAATTAQPRPAVVSTAPEASEGELWALVGASEPASEPATASEATRVVLTILSAFLVLVIVVGAIVLASQIA